MLYALLGGTGTLGYAITQRLLRQPGVKLRLLSRGEHRQQRMQRQFEAYHERLSFFIGDVRDEERLHRVLAGVDRVILMAALKHVNSCEYNVLEAINTNINGAANTVRACLDVGVKQAVLISSDKAVEPVSTYGATKLTAERIFINANFYSPQEETRFHIVRYGNVLGSQGSVVELWRQQLREGSITVSDPSITRFWWTIDDAVDFVLASFDHANRGDIMVPIMHSCSLGELADLVAPGLRWHRIQRYNIEKDHEVMLTDHEAHLATYVSKMNCLRVAHLTPVQEPGWGVGRLDSSSRRSPEARKAIEGML